MTQRFVDNPQDATLVDRSTGEMLGAGNIHQAIGSDGQSLYLPSLSTSIRGIRIRPKSMFEGDRQQIRPTSWEVIRW